METNVHGFDINTCEIEPTKWKCPDESCQKILSRKQTLITHISSFHPNWQHRLSFRSPRGKYKQYEFDPSLPIPKSTWYESRMRNISDLEEDQDQPMPDNGCPLAYPRGLLTLEDNEGDRSSDSDMSLDDETEELVYIESSEDEKYVEKHQDSNSVDPPLYVTIPHQDLITSEITKKEHVMTIGAFATRHNLSNVAVSDLLEILQLHLPTSNMGITSVRSLKEQCGFDKGFLTYNLYCCVCKKLSSNSEETCQTPDCTGANTPDSKKYFVTANISKQLIEIFERPGIWNSIKESRSSPDTHTLSDIKSGSCYKKLKEPGEFLENNDNVTLSMFTDGVPLFKSSSVSLWPVYLLINELPPKERFLRKNMVLWGIWQGVGKPNMIMFLKAFVLDLNDMYYNGFTFIHEDSEIHCRAMMIIATMDLQARAYVLNMTHHNGENGCLYCMDEGERTPSGDGFCRAYRYNDQINMRTEEGVRKSAREARTTGKRVEGFYGESALLYLSYFSIITNIVVDYMHGVLLGVTKKMLEVWFEGKFSKQPWYLGAKTKKIDKILHGICPPYFIHRRPRSITKTYYHWKASELRNWLLFYSLPCLKPHLPEPFLTHFSCLVEGVYILLGEGITSDDLNRSEQLLHAFVKNVEILYGPFLMSMNVHNLTHLASLVEKWGPLWCWSCFPFESFNGDIMKTIHGTGNVCKDVFWHLQAQKQIERAIMDLPDGSKAKRTLVKLTGRDKHSYSNARQCHVIGGESVNDFSQTEKEFLENELGSSNTKEFLKSFKVIHNGFTMYSSKSAKVKKQNSYTIMLNSGAVIEVSRYLLHKDTSQVYASGILAVLAESILTNRVPHLKKLEKGNQHIVVKISQLREPLIVIDTEQSVYAALLPNHFETD